MIFQEMIRKNEHRAQETREIIVQQIKDEAAAREEANKGKGTSMVGCYSKTQLYIISLLP